MSRNCWVFCLEVRSVFTLSVFINYTQIEEKSVHFTGNYFVFARVFYYFITSSSNWKCALVTLLIHSLV